MQLGSHTLVRRVDSDFVNLSPLARYSGSPLPVPGTVPDAIVCSTGPEMIQGLWVPLYAAQVYVNDHAVSYMSSTSGIGLFLSQDLQSSFSQAVTERRDGSFGRPFACMLPRKDIIPGATAIASQLQLHIDDPKTFDLIDVGETPITDSPLSTTEERMFQELCVNLEWEQCETETPPYSIDLQEPVAPPPTNPPKTASRRKSSEPPLRRSKRVADAASAVVKVKTRSRR